MIDELLTRYIEALVYQAVAENMASEQSARMVAMKAATDNAGNLIDEFKLIYNKTRQAAITKELSRDRRRRCRRQRQILQHRTPFKDPQKWHKARSFSASAPWSTSSSRATRCPSVYDALKMEGTALTLEVQQQLGDGVVRTIALGSSDGLRRGMMVTNTGNADHGAGGHGHARPHHGRARQPDRRAGPGRRRR